MGRKFCVLPLVNSRWDGIFSLMSKVEISIHPCEAPIHHENCDGKGVTIDHFTPECIGKLWGWSYEEINAKENLQYLSVPCHREKDKTTEARLTLARRQLKGAYISLELYKTVEDPSFNIEHAPKIPKSTKEKRRKHRDNVVRSGGCTERSRR